MNHLNPDESPDWDDDIDAFEQQLRAIRPAPPAREFSSIADSLAVLPEQTTAAANVRANTSMWRPIVSHAVTAALGLAVGVGVMLLMQPKPNDVPASVGSPKNLADSHASVELVNTPSPNGDSQNVTTPEVVASADYRQPEPVWQSHRGPLRAFGSIDARLASVRDWPLQDQHHDVRQSNDDVSDSDIEYNNLPADKPPLSPRSLHLFLNDLTYSPTSDNPFCLAKDFSS